MEKDGIANPTVEHELFDGYYLGNADNVALIRAEAELKGRITEESPDYQTILDTV